MKIPDKAKTVKRKFYWASAVVIVVVAAVVIVGGWIACERGLHPARDPSRYHLSEFELPSPENVNFESEDLTLTGWFIPGSNGATIVLAHGMGGNRTEMLPHADYLHWAGFTVLLFDFRCRGLSDGKECTLGAREPLDILSAVNYLKKRTDVDPKRIGVQGISLGAASAILAAAKTPNDIQGVVAEIPFTSVNSVLNHTFPHIVGLPSFPFAPVTKWICEYRLGVDFDDINPLNVIGRISPRPILLIDNLNDDLFPSGSVEMLEKAARQPKDSHVHWWPIPDCTHGKGWVTAPRKYEHRVLTFWRETFRINQPK